MGVALNSGMLMSLFTTVTGGIPNLPLDYFSLITVVPCTVIYNLKIFNFKVANHLKPVI